MYLFRLGHLIGKNLKIQKKIFFEMSNYINTSKIFQRAIYLQWEIGNFVFLQIE